MYHMINRQLMDKHAKFGDSKGVEFTCGNLHISLIML